MFKMNIDILSGLPCHRVFICGRDYPWFIYCAIAWWAFVSSPSPTRSSNTRESIWLWDQGGQIAWYIFWMCNFSDFIFTYRNWVILFKMSSHRQLNYYSWVEMNERFRIFMESQKCKRKWISKNIHWKFINYSCKICTFGEGKLKRLQE